MPDGQTTGKGDAQGTHGWGVRAVGVLIPG